MNKDANVRQDANLWLLCALAAIDGMDMQLLPASFRALEASLGMGPFMLAALVACQDVAFSVSGPFWASLSDNGFSRKVLLVTGAAGWGFLTLLLSVVSNFPMMIALRILNGACLGLLIPISQSMVADMPQVKERGYNFGWLDLCNKAVGQMTATLVVTSVSNKIILGIEGWRLAFASVALLSFAVAALVSIYMEESPRQWNPEGVGVLIELKKFVSYFKIRTFVVIVLQGMVGTIPWAALAFSTMYFQYLGMLDWQAAVASAACIFGSGLGSLLGGIIGDRLSDFSESHGRPLTAQLSVFLGIPIVLAIFTLNPPADSSFQSILPLMFVLGVVSSWCSSGCNRPVFCEIVPAKNRASFMAWEFCLEHTCGHIVGPVAVSLISKKMFHYAVERQQVSAMTPAARATNAHALGGAIAFSTTLPWIMCFLLYGLLHCTYKYDLPPVDLHQKDDVNERTRLV
jgi:MFS family permease